ncbi:glycosyltransferase [Cellulosimicrobium cellulans]|uniref:glycosyltransferase n=1 Tax=Cellulosimicrobium cellulans TaxID=1710 RepID=UPI0037F6F149
MRNARAEVLSHGEYVTADLLVIRHPSVITENFFPYGLKVNAVAIIANHVPVDGDGSVNYDVGKANDIATERFGVQPTWYPIGPVVREGLEQFSDIHLSPADWTNIVPPRPTVANRNPPGARPIIGRHSRGQAAKWPESARAIRAAYPLDKEFDVRILGGAEPAKNVLGKTPANWTVYPFDGVAVDDFLSKIDFWVYYHHSSTREAYGRAICEAMQAGCVVILPPYLEKTYGPAALYAEPAEVQRIVREISADPERYSAQSDRGVQFVASLGPEMHKERLEALGVRQSRDARCPVPEETVTPSRHRRTPRVLFVTSNGAGMGHLTRLLSIARRNEGKFRPYFASLSSAVPVVGSYGYPFEYIASSGAMEVGWKGWNSYLIERLELTLERIRPEAVVFDGTVPYGGLLEAMNRYACARVWVRRGMWKSSASAKSLERAKAFDLVIEPGDYARAYDAGPTNGARGAVHVGPMTLLDEHEVLDAEVGRRRVSSGSDLTAPRALITLGAGNINAIGDAQAIAIAEFRAAGWQCFVTKPAIANASGRVPDSGLQAINHYPLAEYARGFDVAVSAAGYNSFHEWMSLGLPTVWIPNEHTSVDDQLARARFAEDFGAGLLARDGDEEAIRDAVRAITSRTTRGLMEQRMELLERPSGAREAADLIANLLS